MSYNIENRVSSNKIKNYIERIENEIEHLKAKGIYELHIYKLQPSDILSYKHLQDIKDEYLNMYEEIEVQNILKQRGYDIDIPLLDSYWYISWYKTEEEKLNFRLNKSFEEFKKHCK
jgi:hypothetical protein